MTAAEKIMVFSSLEELINEIETDRKSTDILSRRYAVRFIMLDNFTVFQKLSLQLTQLGINSFDLEKLLTDKDGWITQDQMKDEIKKLSVCSFVSPFSEIARFYDEDKFKAFFNEISLLENTSENLSRRIYIPLIGLRSRFEKFLDSFGRIAESAPVWSIYSGESQPVLVFLTPNDENYQGFTFPKDYRGLDTMYDWLQFWKLKAPTEKIICSSLPINVNHRHSKPDNIFTINKIKNAYEFITQFLGISINVEYKTSDESYWITLLSYLDRKHANKFDFKKYAHKLFNVYILTVKDIVNHWSNPATKEFERWVLKHYYLNYLNTKNSYLGEIIESSTDYYNATNLLRDILLSIFDNLNEEHIEERSFLLREIDKNVSLSTVDLEKLKSKTLHIAQEDLSTGIKLCSGKFAFEKSLFIEWFQKGKLDYSILQELAPNIAAYILDSDINGWINEYIQAYKRAKIANEYTKEIEGSISTLNESEDSFYKWYHKFPYSKDVLAKNPVDKIYWIDGLGVEYISLIRHLIGLSSFKIKQLEIVRTGIPSSTEHNRFENTIKKQELDSFIHREPYSYPDSINSEIEIINEIFSDILNQSAEMTIAIVSDHGLTALSRLVDSKKYLAKASHEGRYILIESSENSIEDKDYVRCKNNEEHFKVALNHSSLNKKPIREVHGGCCPEEVLVPFLLISNRPEIETSYDIRLLTEEISILDALMKFEITPIPNKVLIQYNGITKNLVNKDNVWQVILDDISIGQMNLTLIIEDCKPQKFSLIIKGSIEEEELF